jgi:type II secretory pathway pseudopilin PulG
MPSPTHSRHGLTLIGLLVIVAILGLLLAMALPIVVRVRDAAARTESINNLKMLALAAHGYHDANRQFPPAVGSPPNAKPSTRGTLFFYLLPYFEQAALYNQADGDLAKNGTYATVIPTLLNAHDKSAPPNHQYKGWLATTNYAANWMVFGNGGKRLASIIDGTSNTFMLGERYQMCGGDPCAWGYGSLYYWAPIFAYYSKGKFQTTPTPAECDPALAQSIDPEGIHMAMCDGSVRAISDRISPQTWWFVCGPADGQVLGPDFE